MGWTKYTATQTVKGKRVRIESPKPHKISLGTRKNKEDNEIKKLDLHYREKSPIATRAIELFLNGLHRRKLDEASRTLKQV